MIIVKRKENSLGIEEIIGFEAFLNGDSYTIIYHRTEDLSSVRQVIPKEGECIDVVDAGKRIVSVMQKKVLWYGAAPK